MAVDQPRIEAAVREILSAIGEDPDRDGLQETPARVARMYTEVFQGLEQDASVPLSTTFDIDHQELVLVREIAFYSMCEHHLLPFHGAAHIGYIPGGGAVTGLSKLARLVNVYAQRPQVQERLTFQIADALMDELGASGAIVVIEAEHMCMSMRGVRAAGARTVTSAVRGMLRENPSTRGEAMALIHGS
ncbi:GTP cyclohydrolase I FolE [Brachybacterium vulturis]|uniref:GTP cyclohydrolase I FolE n=1 Tax=Brachybacterium vulturis TaxID=2017484 RepID=UPI0037359A3D